MDTDKFFAKETPKEKSKRQEKAIAKKIGGRVTSASGAFLHDKGDVVKKRVVRIEAKRTDKDRLTIKREWLKKIRAEAGIEEIPAMNIEIGDENWFIIREREFLELIDWIEGEKDGNKKS
jgi:hypothetical protein